MPLLGGLILGLFTGLADFLARFASKKLALGGAAVAAFAALTVGLYTAMAIIIAGLVTTFPETGPVISTMLWVAIPEQVPVMVSACIAADTAIALYRWNVENLRLVSYVT